MTKIVFTPMSGLYRNKRTAATHILAVMISTECQSKKPYAICWNSCEANEGHIKQSCVSDGQQRNGSKWCERTCIIHISVHVMCMSVGACIYVAICIHVIQNYVY